MAALPGPKLLGPELLGRVLDLLPKRDLHAARLAARIFDEASRRHTGHAATLKLSPSVAAAWEAARAPEHPLTRLRRLRRLELRDWASASLPQLRRAVLAAFKAGALGGVEEFQVVGSYRSSWSPLDAAIWAAALWSMPQLTALELGPSHRDDDAATAALVTVAALGRHLKRLDMCSWRLDADAVAIIAGLPSLEHLSRCCVWAGADDAAAAARLWGALRPCTRLTELVFQHVLPRGGVMPLRPPPDGLPWPHMRVLSNISLPAEHVAALARGLPCLEQLTATPVGDCWERPGVLAGGAFASLTSLELPNGICGSFGRAAPLPRLFPALERLEWTSGCNAVIACDIPGLTRLTYLKMADWNCCQVAISPAVWDGMHLLGRLRELTVMITLDEAPLLARLPPSLTSLDVAVAVERHAELCLDWFCCRPKESCPTEADACDVLRAVASHLSVRKLRFSVCAPFSISRAGIARLLSSGALAGVEELVLDSQEARLHDVSALALLPGLRRLAVRPDQDWRWREDTALEALVAQDAQRGLEIRLLDD